MPGASVAAAEMAQSVEIGGGESGLVRLRERRRHEVRSGLGDSRGGFRLSGAEAVFSGSAFRFGSSDSSVRPSTPVCSTLLCATRALTGHKVKLMMATA